MGCGSHKPYDVQAVVTLDDTPLAEAGVTLISIQKNASSAFGITDAEGNVTFKTKEMDGVLPGSYIAVITKEVEEKILTNNEIRAFAEAGIRYYPKMIELVPEKYTRRETSDLNVKIGYWYSLHLTFNLLSEKPTR